MKKYIVQQRDVGKQGNYAIKFVCPECGSSGVDLPFEPLGKVLAQDVGKICKKINGIWYVESQEQFEKRSLSIIIGE